MCVCLCASLHINAMEECVKAVREHQVPKIGITHGKKRGIEGEREPGNRDCGVALHICETKISDFNTVTMINYRLENRQAHANMHMQTYILTQTRCLVEFMKSFL